jgi:arogenate dehydrogenase (NADP+)
MKQSSVTIIGFGRFGQTLYKLLSKDFRVSVYSKYLNKLTLSVQAPGAIYTKSLLDAYKNDTIFFAVPISAFEDTVARHRKYFEARHVLIDVLSVKVHPERILRKSLKGLKTQALLTHPMFGPDSTQSGFDNLSIVVNQFMTTNRVYLYWKNFFRQKNLNVIEMSPDDHDKAAASSQGLTHFIGRLLEQYNMNDTEIDTLGARQLLAIERQTVRDTWELFNDLQHYNPYTTNMRLKLGKAYNIVYNKLLPAQVSKDHLTIGIQGGKGSFNEEAALFWLKKSNITGYKIIYLYTSERVLCSLHQGKIDRGQFAIHNSVGGLVDESITAMSGYTFSIIEEFAIRISHTLMKRADANSSCLTAIMAHPQVFAQCHETLKLKYPMLRQTSGKGDLIDHANVAKQLSIHKLPKNIGVMGSKVLAEMYNLAIIEDNLQDAQNNFTSFLVVSR